MTSPFAAPNTDRSTVLALGLKEIVEANKLDLGIQQVLYGDQLMVPGSPAVVIRAGRKRRTLRGVAAPGGKVDNSLTVLVDVMAADVLSGEEASRLAVDTLAENVEKLFYVDVTIGGLVIHGFVEDWDPGAIFINNSKWRTVRMTYVGRTVTYLSPPAAPV